MKNKEYRIVIVEPSDLMTIGLRTIINQLNHCVLVATFYDIAHAVEQIDSLGADVVIINPMLASFHKRADIRHLFPESKVIAIHYTYIDKEMLLQFPDVIAVNDTAEQIKQKLERVVAAQHIDISSSETEELSDREKEILVAVAKGLINKQIAALYNISIHTVISHRKNITRKIGIKSVSGLGVYALLNNMIEEHEIQ